MGQLVFLSGLSDEGSGVYKNTISAKKGKQQGARTYHHHRR